MIETSGLTKYYGETAAIRDVSFRVEKGEILGFLGPNGAGKSTTMRILAGCLAPSDGTARIAGYDILEQSQDARRSLGYLPEQVPLYPEMSVEEYLRFAGALHGMAGGRISERIGEVAARCGLADVRRKLIGRLSKGYRQRVGLAQALLHDPPALILDEPTVGLDPRQIIEVRDLIRGLAGDHTVLLSTHILAEVSVVCTRVAIIHRGRIVAEDSLERLTGQAGGAQLILEARAPARELEDRLRAVPGIATVAASAGRAGASRATAHLATDGAESARAAAAKAVISAGFDLLEMRVERLTLEDVFVRATTGDAEVTR